MGYTSTFSIGPVKLDTIVPFICRASPLAFTLNVLCPPSNRAGMPLDASPRNAEAKGCPPPVTLGKKRSAMADFSSVDSNVNTW